MSLEQDIETERLLIIPFRANDLHLLHSTFTDSFVRKYLWDDQVIPLDETKRILDVNLIYQGTPTEPDRFAKSTAKSRTLLLSQLNL